MKNYRGIQLTHQISKVVERVISCLMKPTIDSMHLFGTSQFAYSSDHSSRDALLFMVCSWLLAFASHDRVGLYCSDVSGAFDNVCRNILIRKLNDYFHGNLVYVLSSWLALRKANVCVGGKMSNGTENNECAISGNGAWIYIMEFLFRRCSEYRNKYEF